MGGTVVVTWHPAIAWNKLARYAPSRIAHLKGAVPPCAVAALFRAWLSGWCTARRFQQIGKSRLCKSCKGADSLEHYARRDVTWAWIGKCERINVHERSLARFLVLDLQPGDCPILLTVNLYAVYSTVNHWRAMERRGTLLESLSLIKERWRFIETMSPKLMSRLASRFG